MAGHRGQTGFIRGEDLELNTFQPKTAHTVRQSSFHLIRIFIFITLCFLRHLGFMYTRVVRGINANNYFDFNRLGILFFF